MKKKEKLPEDFDFDSFSQEAIQRLKQGEELTGKEGILTPLIKKILEQALEAELSQHFEDAETAAPTAGMVTIASG
jgi:putative transposase